LERLGKTTNNIVPVDIGSERVPKACMDCYLMISLLGDTGAVVEIRTVSKTERRKRGMTRLHE
jgi:hypothetical protein